MSKNENLRVLCGAEPQAPARPLAPFSGAVVEYLSALSAALLKDGEAKAYPDVVTFAFFCRRAHLEQLRAEYEGQLSGRVGRGTVFHIAPSNVPINFAYSLAASLLAGNANIVKASSQDFPQTRIVCRVMAALLAESFQALLPYVRVVVYPREEQSLTESFSGQCDARVIWGGDETVRRVRQAALPPRAFDLTFADRYSLLCVRPEAVLAMDGGQLAKAAKGFYDDTYLTDQNACTAPRLVYWVGEESAAAQAQARFWAAVQAYVAPRYRVEPVTAVDKLTAGYRAAIEWEGVKLLRGPDNLILRVSVPALTPGMEDIRSGGGFFVEYTAPTLESLKRIVTPKYQTLSYLGFAPEELRSFITDSGLRGVDRIAPVGHTMDFALVWDGYDLIRTLSRQIFAM